MMKKLYNFFTCFKTGFLFAGSAGIKYCIVRLAQIILPLAQLYTVSYIVEISMGNQTNECELSFVTSVCILAGIIGMQWISASFMYSYKNEAETNLLKELGSKILHKKEKIKFVLFEDKDISDLSTRVSDNIEKSFSDIVFSLLDILYIFIRIVTLFLAVLSEMKIVAVVFALGILPLFLLTRKLSEAKYQSNKKLTILQRKNYYYKEMLCEKEYATERYHYSYADGIIRKWNNTHKAWVALKKKNDLRWYSQVQMGSFITQAICLFIIAFILKGTQSGVFRQGIFISFVTSAVDLVSIMSWTFNYAVDGIVTSGEYANEYIEFMNLPEEYNDNNSRIKIGDKKIQLINIESVSFSYNNNDKPAINNLTMTFEAGKVYAVVGKNGAGKTSLIKLLLGLYETYLGNVKINGIELRKCDLIELRTHFAVALQKFGKYNVSLKDNLSFGRDLPEQRIKNAVCAVGLDYLLKNNEFDLILGNDQETGRELSGGEWQRLCIARALTHTDDVRIFDEPTASLDPIAEADIYDKIIDSHGDSITILVTHRLGSIVRADHIFFLSDGRVVEQGTHEELMKMKGLYYKMFNMQKEWYV